MQKKLVVPAEVFSRISGYFRPVNQWNRGKREEFRNRKLVSPARFSLPHVCSVICEKKKISA